MRVCGGGRKFCSGSLQRLIAERAVTNICLRGASRRPAHRSPPRLLLPQRVSLQLQKLGALGGFVSNSLQLLHSAALVQASDCCIQQVASKPRLLRACLRQSVDELAYSHLLGLGVCGFPHKGRVQGARHKKQLRVVFEAAGRVEELLQELARFQVRGLFLRRCVVFENLADAMAGLPSVDRCVLKPGSSIEGRFKLGPLLHQIVHLRVQVGDYRLERQVGVNGGQLCLEHCGGFPTAHAQAHAFASGQRRRKPVMERVETMNVTQNWTLVQDPDFTAYTKELLAKVSVQLNRVERDDPTTVVVLSAAVVILVFSICFAVVTCALRCCLRNWQRLVDEEPPPSAEDTAAPAQDYDLERDPDDVGPSLSATEPERGVELD